MFPAAWWGSARRHGTTKLLHNSGRQLRLKYCYKTSPRTMISGSRARFVAKWDFSVLSERKFVANDLFCFFFFFFLFLCYLLTTLRIRYPGVRYSRFTFELSYVVCMFFFYEFAMGCAHNSFSIKLIVETKLSFLFFFLVTSMIDHFNMYILNFFVNFGVIAFKCNWWNTPIGIQVSLENVLPPRTYEITVYICNTMPTTIFTWTKIIGIIPYCITLRDHFSKAQDISS